MASGVVSLRTRGVGKNRSGGIPSHTTIFRKVVRSGSRPDSTRESVAKGTPISADNSRKLRPALARRSRSRAASSVTSTAADSTMTRMLHTGCEPVRSCVCNVTSKRRWTAGGPVDQRRCLTSRSACSLCGPDQGPRNCGAAIAARREGLVAAQRDLFPVPVAALPDPRARALLPRVTGHNWPPLTLKDPHGL